MNFPPFALAGKPEFDGTDIIKCEGVFSLLAIGFHDIRSKVFRLFYHLRWAENPGRPHLILGFNIFFKSELLRRDRYWQAVFSFWRRHCTKFGPKAIKQRINKCLGPDCRLVAKYREKLIEEELGKK